MTRIFKIKYIVFKSLAILTYYFIVNEWKNCNIIKCNGTTLPERQNAETRTTANPYISLSLSEVL